MEDKNLNENLEDVEELLDTVDTEGKCADESTEESSENIKEMLSKKEAECEEYLDLLKRTKAEYDNFRKRTQKEKEGLFDEGFRTSIEKIIPVLDNLERALEHSDEEGALKEGLEMILKMFKDILEKEGVSLIPSKGEKFDPNLHNAVMHIDDDAYGDNEVVEVLLEGYTYKDKVIRHSMVKVAN
ncbi:nucleotide exchange factor GrpE [Clostridium cylindrosporum]|uniref:Protein GrpE n=1 Tax=Clostridium cylindrosporum DSM 605 TaxID=1121307 RepID=A0A0J8D6C2_CLOCY|nr:nucleotide exchange factor GrpE [Clostridium cylindrosporum]KMT21640.1 molecular chaperone GrpE [Clostridium cylindrosporum DSM 605]